MSNKFCEEKKEIEKILNSEMEVESKETLNVDYTTYSNGIRSWIGSIFVDIVDSSSFFKNKNISDKTKSKIIRAFCHGLISIFNVDNVQDLGIRGDCVYAVFPTPHQKDIYKLFNLACEANTFLKMLNSILKNKNYPQIKAGIGLACNNDLIIKAGAKSQFNDYIWIGSTLVDANKLSKIANRNNHSPIVLSSVFYSNMIELFEKENPNAKKFFVKKTDYSFNYYYECDLVYTGISNWIDNGMKGEI